MTEQKRNDRPLGEKRFANGLLVTFFDRTNRYYGAYHRVVAEVVSQVPLTTEVFAGEDDPQSALQKARQQFGQELTVRQTLERMGVQESCLEGVRDELWQSFLRSNLQYLQHPEFPARLVRRELARRRSRPRLYPVQG